MQTEWEGVDCGENKNKFKTLRGMDLSSSKNGTIKC